MNVLALCGSLRVASYNAALLRAAIELAPPGMTITPYSLAPVPMFNGDLIQDGTFPATVDALREAVANADALLFVSPEYNYSIPAVLKNAIDWISRAPNPPAGGKPAAVMGVSPGMLGTARMQYHLRQVGVFLDLHFLNKPEVMVGKAAEKFDAELRLTDEATRKVVAAQLVALQAWTNRLRG